MPHAAVGAMVLHLGPAAKPTVSARDWGSACAGKEATVLMTGWVALSGFADALAPALKIVKRVAGAAPHTLMAIQAMQRGLWTSASAPLSDGRQAHRSFFS